MGYVELGIFIIKLMRTRLFSRNMSNVRIRILVIFVSEIWEKEVFLYNFLTGIEIVFSVLPRT